MNMSWSLMKHKMRFITEVRLCMMISGDLPELTGGKRLSSAVTVL
jgi:hypothetical protein